MNARDRLTIALYQPDIPGNTGAIMRLAACLGIGIDVIGPAGFDHSDKALRRAADRAGFSIDTRTLQRGEIFVALSDIRDGHEFVKSAFEKGASAALVARAPNDTPDGAPLLVVPDTLEGLRDLARAAHPI